MGPSGRITHVIGYILHCLGQHMQVLYLGRAPCTKETLPDFLKWCRVTRHPLVFHGLTGTQRTPWFWGVTPAVKATFRLTAIIFSFLDHISDKIPLEGTNATIHVS